MRTRRYRPAVFGANATGKSNLMFALVTMRNLVMQSTSLTGAQLAEVYTPFRLDAYSATEPTEFEVTVILDGVRYQYGFAYDARRICAEWLLVYHHARGQKWFERHCDSAGEADSWEPFSAYFTGSKETWKKATRPQALFLTTAVQLNSEQLQPLFEWFVNGMILLTAPGPLSLSPTIQRLEDKDYKARILGLLRAADIHVADIKVETKSGQQVEFRLEPGKSPEAMLSEAEIPEIEFLHQVEGEKPVWFDRRYESAGTQRLLAYAGPLLDAIENGRLLVIDELDRSLHPLLARFVVRLIHNPDISRNAVQLWITTHDTTLLDTDLLRRDEIWFVDKDAKQSTRLSPLSDFKPRKGDVLERGYLMGRYGGIPFVRNLKRDGFRER